MVAATIQNLTNWNLTTKRKQRQAQAWELREKQQRQLARCVAAADNAELAGDYERAAYLYDLAKRFKQEVGL